MGCGGSKKLGEIDSNIAKVLAMLKGKPNLSRFGRNNDAVSNIESCYGSKVFGGTVFEPVGSGPGK